MANVTKTTILPLLSERIKQYAESVIWADGATPLLADMELTEDTGEGGGRKVIVPFSTGGGQGVANPSFPQAQAGATAGKHNRWEIDLNFLTGSMTLDVQAILSAQGEAQKLDVVKRETELHLEEWRRRLAHYIQGNGFAALANYTSRDTTSFTVPPAFASRFREDMFVVASTTEGGALAEAVGTQITGVNEDTGQITVSGNPTALGWNATGFVYVKGTNDGSGTKLVFSGADDWIPQTAPGATLFYNVNRQNRFDLGGRRFDCQGKQYAEALIKGVNKLFNATGESNLKIYCDSIGFGNMTADRDAFKVTQERNPTNNIGYQQTLLYGTNAGTIPVVPDITLAGTNRWYAINQGKRFKPYLIHASGGLINVLDINGVELTAVSNAMAYEIRTYAYLAMAVPVPGRNLVGFNWGVA